SGWLSTMKRSSVDPDLLAVSMNTGDSQISSGPLGESSVSELLINSACHTNADLSLVHFLLGSTGSGSVADREKRSPRCNNLGQVSWERLNMGDATTWLAAQT